MPRRRTLVALGTIVLATAFGLFLTTGHLSSNKPLLDLGEGTPAHAPPPAPAPPPTQAPTLAPTVAPFSFRYPIVVDKKAVSSRMRVVFLVGLEGTGHHYLADVFQSLCEKASVPCPKVCAMAHALYPGMSLPASRKKYEEARKSLREEMKKLAAYPDEHLPEGRATMVSFGKCRFEAGMMSYPNFNGEQKSLQYVDFRLLAEEAERAGVDLRIIYLSRSAKNIVVSDTQHNNYGGSMMMESRILLNNAAVVDSTFRELDPAFTTCFRYEDMSDPAQAARVAEFVAPNEYIAKRLADKMLANVKDRSTAAAAGLSKESARARWEKRQPQGRLPHGDSRLRSRWDDRGNGGRQLNSGAKEAEAAAAGKKQAEGSEGHGSDWDLSWELVVARLQQKLDMIESNVCAGANSTLV